MLHTLVVDKDARFTIDADTKKIINGTSEKLKLMQYEHNSERVTFEMSRYVEGHDMMECNVNQVHYINLSKNKKQQNEGVYDIEDKVLSDDENSIVFSWLISRGGTQIAGTLNFLVLFSCAKEDGTIEYLWSTDICKDIVVSAGMNNSNKVMEEYVDVLEQWKQRVLAEALSCAQGALPFKAEYGITSYADIKAAYDNGRNVCAQMKVEVGEEDVAGIYYESNLMASWDDMMNDGFIEHEGNGLWSAVQYYSGISGMDVTKIILPRGLTRIIDNLFSDTANWSFGNLKTIIIPNTVTSIETGAFGEDCCEGLDHIAIPSSVTTIHENAFSWIPEVVYYDGEIGDWLQGESEKVQPYASAPDDIKPAEIEEVNYVTNLNSVKTDAFEFICMSDDLTVTKLVCNSSGWENMVMGTITATTVRCFNCGVETVSTDGYTDKYGNHMCGSCLADAFCGMCGESLAEIVANGGAINDTNSMGWCCESCYDDLGDS